MSSSRRLRSGILPAAIILLTVGCASVPIRTALRLRSLTPEALLSADPERIRAAVQIDRGVRLDAGTSSLVISLLPATDGLPAETHSVLLRTLISGADVHPDLPRADPGRYWTILGVSSRGIGALEEIQRRLADPRGEYSGMQITVKTAFGELPEELRDGFSIEIWIHLLPEQGFLKLYETTLDASQMHGEPRPE